jgi:hypothetical protein
MSIQDGSIEFQLTRPIKYKFDNTTHEATHVVLQEPGMEHIKFYDRIDQMITKAQMDYMQKLGERQSMVGEAVKPFQEQAKEIESQADDTYKALEIMLKDSDRVELSQFNSTFAKMACVINPSKSICLIDGRLAMNSTLWENLHPKDAKEMALRWASFFAMPLEEGGQTTSEQPSTSQPQPMEA